MQGIRIADTLSYLPYYVRTYVPYGFLPPIIVIRVHSAMYNRLYRGIFRGRDSVHARTFSRNIWASASVQAHTISRNVCARASTIIHSRASTSILAHTSACLCVSVYGLPRSSVHMPPQAYVHAVAVSCVCLLLCPT